MDIDSKGTLRRTVSIQSDILSKLTINFKDILPFSELLFRQFGIINVSVVGYGKNKSCFISHNFSDNVKANRHQKQVLVGTACMNQGTISY